jgi:hypothetical protein
VGGVAICVCVCVCGAIIAACSENNTEGINPLKSKFAVSLMLESVQASRTNSNHCALKGYVN